MMVQYTYGYKSRYDTVSELENNEQFDFFLSAFNGSDRVNSVFEGIRATEKHWLILPEYGITQVEHPNHSNVHVFPQNSESEIIRSFFKKVEIDFNKKVCIDITGFLRPHLAFLVRLLHQKGVKKAYFLYSDPKEYAKKEKTTFASIHEGVEQIKGYMGNHGPETDNDILIVGAGYDSDRITEVAKAKSRAKKVLMFGFPSLQPDFFQHNIIRAYEAEEATVGQPSNYLDPEYSLFAPANDPFVTAQVLSDYVKGQQLNRRISNLYLSPLSTKVQALGMCMFYLYECLNDEIPTSIIFPFCARYERVTSTGISRISVFTFVFPS